MSANPSTKQGDSTNINQNKKEVVQDQKLPRVREIKPKRPRQLHMLFWLENSKKLVEEEKISHKEAWHRSNKEWNNLKDRSQYQHLVDKDKARYEREMEERLINR